jgi:hypothetical protein
MPQDEAAGPPPAYALSRPGCGQPPRQRSRGEQLPMQGLSQIGAFDHEFMASVEHWALGIRIRLLNRLGPSRGAGVPRSDARRANSLETGHRQVARFVHVDSAWAMRDPGLLGGHAGRVARIAQSIQPYSRVIALICQGLARQTTGEWASASRPSWPPGLLRVTRGPSISSEPGQAERVSPASGRATGAASARS